MTTIMKSICGLRQEQEASGAKQGNSVSLHHEKLTSSPPRGSEMFG